MKLRINGSDISPDFKYNRKDAKIMREIIKFEGKPHAIQRFARDCDGLTDYGYWFLLGTLWVSYTGWSSLKLWRKLFASDRPRRDTSLMKPSELRAFRELPDEVPCFRAHRPGEEDWLSYTLSIERAVMFAQQRGVEQVTRYLVPKREALCLFLRRGEFEVLALEPGVAKRVGVVEIVRDESADHFPEFTKKVGGGV